VSTIILDVVDEMSRNLLKAFWDRSPKSLIVRKLVFEELLDLQCLSILPLLVPKSFVNPDYLFVVTRYLEAVFVNGLQSVTFEPGLVDHARKLLRILSIFLATLPSWCL
jgi:hypothetical protein